MSPAKLRSLQEGLQHLQLSWLELLNMSAQPLAAPCGSAMAGSQGSSKNVSLRLISMQHFSRKHAETPCRCMQGCASLKSWLAAPTVKRLTTL
jgi:hypothetical protein